MKIETIVHLTLEMGMEAKAELLDKISQSMEGISKPDEQTEKTHALKLVYDDTKIAIHDLPAIIEKFGVISQVVS